MRLKKTTYVIIGMVTAPFVLILLLFMYIHSTGTPRKGNVNIEYNYGYGSIEEAIEAGAFDEEVIVPEETYLNTDDDD